MLGPRIYLPLIALLTTGSVVLAKVQTRPPAASRISTGRFISPQGKQTEVGSFPANMAVSFDGNYVAVVNTGFRQQLTVINFTTGWVTDKRDFNAELPNKKGTQSLYFGVVFGPHNTLYVSRGSQDQASSFTLDSNGKLIDGPTLDNPPGPKKPALLMAGVALSGDGKYLYACNNETSADTHFRGSLSVIDIANNQVVSHLVTPGFPLAVTSITREDRAPHVYISSERDGKVSSVDVSDPVHPHITKQILCGAQPTALLLNHDQTQLYIANSGSDTVTVVDTKTDRITTTILLRPDGALRLPGATPLGLALSPDQKRLYVTLADMNAVAVVDLAAKIPQVSGMIPTGWYPTAVVANPDGKQIWVANAKGVRAINPNKKNAGPNGAWGQYIENILEGTISQITLPDTSHLRLATAQVLENNQIHPNMEWATFNALPKTGIKHVVYIVKENRTYDEVLGDIPNGNGDPSMVLFGQKVTPNQHALANRFVLLDNFYCSGEVSGDGWNWSTSGMGSEYVVRNLPYNYSGRGRSYDFEGTTNGYPVDVKGIPDVARAPGGYIWDGVAARGLSYRNYGFFNTFASELASSDPANKDPRVIKDNTPNKLALVGHTDPDFYHFDMTYPDSSAWIKYGQAAPTQRKSYGTHAAPSRFAEWKREFDLGIHNHDLPAFSMVRFCRDHTNGTTPGFGTPRALVADNDYAVGRLVEEISKSPFWSSTAIFVVEDDAQDGFDHVDAHRSPCYVISPLIKAGTVDHHFYNTDSVLRTMESLLGIPPMSQYDATAPVLSVFNSKPVNSAPFNAILPARSVITETNAATAYRASESAKMDFSREDQVSSEFMQDILWHSVRG